MWFKVTENQKFKSKPALALACLHQLIFTLVKEIDLDILTFSRPGELKEILFSDCEGPTSMIGPLK